VVNVSYIIYGVLHRYLVHLGKKARDSLPAEGSGSSRAKKGSGGPLAIRNMASALPNEVCKYIKDLGISKIVLSEEDIKTILDTLVYDGKVQKKRVMSGEEAYWACNSLLPSPGLTVIPCSVCPAVYSCHSNTILTSIDCQHLTTWSEKIDNTKHMAEF
jgi:DNA-directed RNA polymerase III subunit RPC6